MILGKNIDLLKVLSLNVHMTHIEQISPNIVDPHFDG